MNRGETQSEWNLSRRQKKSGTYLIVAAILGLLALNSYLSGNMQLAQVLGFLAFIVLLVGIVD